MVVALLEGGAAEGRRVAAGPGADLARARSEFLSLVSHELRTPLNGMLGLGSILKTRLAGEPERELLDGMLASAEHLRDLVERILHFSDAETGEFRLDEAEVALGEVMEQALRRNGAVARTTGKRLRLERSPAMAAVLRIDLAQIAVALDCVIANALAHGGSDVAVEAALSDEGEALLAVSDDGPGLFEASGDVAFPPFEIGGPVMTRGVGGLGLGLPLARRLVELHAGDLQLDRSRGRTRARIRLPRTRVGGA
jgi:signal transduction histidine kinase